jgi:hypothetical protein
LHSKVNSRASSNKNKKDLETKTDQKLKKKEEESNQVSKFKVTHIKKLNIRSKNYQFQNLKKKTKK